MTWFTSCVKNDIKHDTIFFLPLNSDPSRPLTPEGFAQVLGGRGRVLAVQTPARPLSFPTEPVRDLNLPHRCRISSVEGERHVVDYYIVLSWSYSCGLA